VIKIIKQVIRQFCFSLLSIIVLILSVSGFPTDYKIINYQLIDYQEYYYEAHQQLTASYIEEDSNIRFEVTILNHTEKSLNDYISYVVHEATKQEYKNHTIFVNNDTQSMFWFSEQIQVSITSGLRRDLNNVDLTSEQFERQIHRIGNGNFPQGLIDAYLKEYPSTCSEDSCEGAEEEFYIDKKPTNLAKIVAKYVGLSIDCPVNVTLDNIRLIVDSKFERDFVTSEYENFTSQCLIDPYMSYRKPDSFYVPPAQPDEFLLTCRQDLDNQIQENLGISPSSAYVKTLTECETRRYLIENYPELQDNKKLLNDTINERTDNFLITFENANKNRQNTVPVDLQLPKATEEEIALIEELRIKYPSQIITYDMVKNELRNRNPSQPIISETSQDDVRSPLDRMIDSVFSIFGDD
jgi:hypothetical protein